jgi:DNA-binding transcriptional regulator PaaX
MKYFLLLLLCLSLQSVFAQDENRHASAQTPVDSAAVAARRFEGKLTRLREAVEKNDVSSMTACYANLLGDMRSAIEHEAAQKPEGEKLASMQKVFAKFETFTFDPMKPAELKPRLPDFDDFLKLLKE